MGLKSGLPTSISPLAGIQLWKKSQDGTPFQISPKNAKNLARNFFGTKMFGTVSRITLQCLLNSPATIPLKGETFFGSNSSTVHIFSERILCMKNVPQSIIYSFYAHQFLLSLIATPLQGTEIQLLEDRIFQQTVHS